MAFHVATISKYTNVSPLFHRDLIQHSLLKTNCLFAPAAARSKPDEVFTSSDSSQPCHILAAFYSVYGGGRVFHSAKAENDGKLEQQRSKKKLRSPLVAFGSRVSPYFSCLLAATMVLLSLPLSMIGVFAYR